MKKSIILLTGLLIISSLISACQPQNIPTSEIMEVTRIVEKPVVITQIVTQLVYIETTPIPPTAIPPTPIPTLDDSSDFYKYYSQQVIEAFLFAGLDGLMSSVMSKSDYGAAPYVAIEGTHFIIPSLCADCGGRIMSFATKEDLELTKSYYDELGKQSALFFSWTFVKDNILVQINGDLPEETAKLYEKALDEMK